MQHIHGRVVNHRAVGDRYRQITVDVSALTEPIRSGQFFHVRCGDDKPFLLRRPFSVYRYEEQRRQLDFLYLIKGEGTRRLAEKRPGDDLDLIGPLGRGFHFPAKKGPILLVGRGVGIATLNALAEDAARAGRTVFALISARLSADVLAKEELRKQGATVLTVTDRAGTSALPHVSELLAALIVQENIAAMYTCGSKRLLRLTKQLAKRHHLYAEAAIEAPMACGIGNCYACAYRVNKNNGIKTVRVCLDGPVFPVDQVVLS